VLKGLVEAEDHKVIQGTNHKELKELKVMVVHLVELDHKVLKVLQDLPTSD
jgi:hypothetical protein